VDVFIIVFIFIDLGQMVVGLWGKLSQQGVHSSIVEFRIRPVLPCDPVRVCLPKSLADAVRKKDRARRPGLCRKTEASLHPQFRSRKYRAPEIALVYGPVVTGPDTSA
jgi:hypothetical protein